MKSAPNATRSAKGKSSNVTTSNRDKPQQSKKKSPNIRRIDSENEDGEDILSESFPEDQNADEESSDEDDGVDDLHLKPGGADSGAKESQSSSSREAKDINHFFERGDKKKNEKTICVTCRYVLQPSDP
jgi:hypothetical protein